MSGITDPSEEYFKDGLWAWVANQWKKLVADASNFLQINIAAQDIDVEIKQTTAADLTPGVMGWDGTQWRKLPMVWGYSDRWAAHAASTTGAAGTRSLTITHTGTGEVWVLEQISALGGATTPSGVLLEVEAASVPCVLLHDSALVSGEWVFWHGRTTLKKDDLVRLYFYNCGLNDTILLRVWGYKMKTAE